MSSKIEKQKQILALLNARYAQSQNTNQTIRKMQYSSASVSEQAQSNLISRLYHFYKTVIQNINAGLLTIDLKGEITFANKRAADLLGYKGEELLGKSILDFFKDKGEAEHILQLLVQRKRPFNEKETHFLQKGGKEIIVSLDASLLKDESNRFEGACILFRDVTEIHQLRRQVERMERLALLGELSAGIAHEIRNPLAGIKAAAQVLQENFAQEDVPTQLIDRIVREVDKANRLLKEFFKFARPTPPKFWFHDIEMIIDGVYLLLAPRLKNRNIDYISTSEPDIPQVYVDETQIEQVILNLFLNAIDAMPEGGKIMTRISKKKISLLEEEKANLAATNQELYYVLVEITDTGVGIAPENLNKIFNPFFTTKPEGLGLGLSICSRLIEENRGKIDVVSTPGKGTTFILALPSFVHR